MKEGSVRFLQSSQGLFLILRSLLTPQQKVQIIPHIDAPLLRTLGGYLPFVGVVSRLT